MLPLNFLSGKGLCPKAGRTRCRSIVRLIVTESVTSAALPRQATTPNPIDRCSCTHSDGLGTESLAAHTRGRRQLMTSAAIAAAAHWLALPQPAASRGARGQKVGPQLLAAFQEALSAQSHEDIEAAWTKAINLAPDNAAAWSNRGTARLQIGQWQAAYEDLLVAAHLEEQQHGAADGLTLNNLGNAEGALGRWQDALQHYEAAADDADIGSIALANYALAAFENGSDVLAIKSARTLLRRDAQFMDMRCALVAFLWGSGQRSAAEGQWEQLQQDADGLGAAVYSRSAAVERVRHRWPPRATAALDAFLSLSDVGHAEGYDLQMHEYKFAVLRRMLQGMWRTVWVCVISIVICAVRQLHALALQY